MRCIKLPTSTRVARSTCVQNPPSLRRRALVTSAYVAAVCAGALLAWSDARAQMTFDMGNGIYITPQTQQAPTPNYIAPSPYYQPAPVYQQQPIYVQPSPWPQPMQPHYRTSGPLPR